MSLRAGRALLLSFSADIKVMIYPSVSFLLLSYTPKIDKAMIRLIRITHDIPLFILSIIITLRIASNRVRASDLV